MGRLDIFVRCCLVVGCEEGEAPAVIRIMMQDEFRCVSVEIVLVGDTIKPRRDEQGEGLSSKIYSWFYGGGRTSVEWFELREVGFSANKSSSTLFNLKSKFATNSLKEFWIK